MGGQSGDGDGDGEEEGWDFRAVGGAAFESAPRGGLEVKGNGKGFAGSERREDGQVDVGGDEPTAGKGEGVGVDDRPQGNGIIRDDIAVFGIAEDEEKVGRDVVGSSEAEVEADGIDGQGDAQIAGGQWSGGEEGDAAEGDAARIADIKGKSAGRQFCKEWPATASRGVGQAAARRRESRAGELPIGSRTRRMKRRIRRGGGNAGGDGGPEARMECRR